jgi:hypothetical protein
LADQFLSLAIRREDGNANPDRCLSIISGLGRDAGEPVGTALWKEKGPSGVNTEGPFKKLENEALDHSHVSCSRPLGTLLDVKANSVAFVERSEPTGINRRMMNENIRTVFLLDKTKPLAVIEPLHDTICHANILLRIKNF